MPAPSGLCEIRSLLTNSVWPMSMLNASDEPTIHELQHLHWNCFLVKTLTFKPTTKRNSLGDTGDTLISEPDDSDIFAASLVSHNIPWFKIGDH
jgi:hypothetical protein